MTRQVLYVCHPLRPTEEEIEAHRHAGWMGPLTADEMCKLALRANLDRAILWLAWLRRSFPETTFIAPWIVEILSGADDSDPAQREAGMQGNFAVIERCDGIVLCGGRISEGMRREMEHGLARGLDDSCEPHLQTFEVYDLTWLCYDPNDLADMEPSPGMSFDRWYAAVLHGRTT